ncbi:MAG TPA: DUF4325 domain-containing protein [Coxiellaceae bacterium]|nr:DUF4325 domain-containing protein [Coxiellaceae bacterium]
MTTPPDKIKAFILNHVSAHPGNIVTYTAQHFRISRMTAHRHLQMLIREAKVLKTGTTRQSRYYLIDAPFKTLSFKIKDKSDEFSIWKTYFEPTISQFKKNIYTICEYGFTEIFNNAKDHSNGTLIKASMQWQKNSIKLTIADNGIGIFRKIEQAFHLEKKENAILELAKGKVTTDPENHTGEGIFFSSQAFDYFSIQANELLYMRDNIQHDWYLKAADHKTEGTMVEMILNLNSHQNIIDIFRQYQNPETLSFDRTHILVELSKLGDERYISRSQAKRITTGLEKFNHITLDFKNIEAVGQGFVDEVFRVFKNKHPTITIDYVHTNKEVLFMIQRSTNFSQNPF